jgi:hypothetical protein
MTLRVLALSIAALSLAMAQPDPGLPGPLQVQQDNYTYGDTAFQPTGFPVPVELTGTVIYPQQLQGPYPVALFLHGRHVTCFVPGTGLTALRWPCTPPQRSIPSYRGYDYIGRTLASHGYVVISISANGINAADNSTADAGMQARAELVQRHLEIWKTLNTTGGAPFGTKFVGKLNLNNVGTMGHSRGGEGVVRHFLLNKSLGSPFGIKAVFPLAPVDFGRPVANEVPLSVMLPYCDGDVADLQGVHFYDDARYNVPGDLSPKHTQLVLGANHNFFNLIWTPPFAGGVDDWNFVFGGGSDPHCGTTAASERLTPAQQRAVGLAYMAGFFRLYLGGETDLAVYFNGNSQRPASIGTARVFPSYHAPDSTATRLDVNRLLTATNLTTNTAGGAATQNLVTPYTLCGGQSPQPAKCLPAVSDAQQPHTTPSAFSNQRGLSQLQAGWSSTQALYRNDIPAAKANVSALTAVVFRAAVNFGDARNTPGLPQDLKVRLTDGSGGTAAVSASAFSPALFYPPGSVSPVPKNVLNTIRVPLSAFTGVNLTDVRSVTIEFTERSSGALLISDIAFAK